MPPELQGVIDEGERTDFIANAKRKVPLKSALGFVFFGIFWLGFISIFWAVFLLPVFLGNQVNFTSNGVPVTAGWGNLAPLYVPAGIILLFTCIGLGIFGRGVYLIFAKGGWFVGTPQRLIHYAGKKLLSYDWEQFSGVTEVSGTPEKGTLVLQLRTGKMVNRKNRPDEYVPDAVIASGITNVFAIEKLCRKRIEEHDPTPIQSATSSFTAARPSASMPSPTNPISFKGIHE